MKRRYSILAAMMAAMGLSMTVSAEEGTCTVTAETVTVTETGQVQMPIKISGNVGFTNLGIALDYDRDQLELTGILTGDGEQDYLCGSLVSVNPSWVDDEDGKLYGYITGASESEIREDGILFVATFDMKDVFSNTEAVIPVVKYLRSNENEISEFESRGVLVEPGSIILNASSGGNMIPGDFDGNGSVTLKDVMSTLGAYKKGSQLSEAQKDVIDLDGDGIASLKEVMKVLGLYKQQGTNE